MKSETKFRDILALFIWANLRSKGNWLLFTIVGLIVSFGKVFPMLPSKQHIALDALMLIAGFGAMLFILLLTSFAIIILLSILLVAVIAMHNFFKKGSDIGLRSFSVNDQFFTEDDGEIVTNIPWKDIKGIYKTSRYIFVKSAWFRYAIIPRRDFSNEYEFVSYYANMIKFLDYANMIKSLDSYTQRYL